MTPPAEPERYKNHRFPGEIISHGVWLYYRFSLSYRDVQEILFERGITVTHEAIRQWCLKFGQDYANQLKRRRAQPGDKWHLDEVFLTINGKRHYLWRGFCQVVEAEMLIRQAGASPWSSPPFRRPAPYPLLRPNSRIDPASPRGTPM